MKYMKFFFVTSVDCKATTWRSSEIEFFLDFWLVRIINETGRSCVKPYVKHIVRILKIMRLQLKNLWLNKSYNY